MVDIIDVQKVLLLGKFLVEYFVDQNKDRSFRAVFYVNSFSLQFNSGCFFSYAFIDKI